MAVVDINAELVTRNPGWRAEQIDKALEALDESVTPDALKCHYCNDAGIIACRSRDGQYAFAGPAPDDAKGYFDADCYNCSRAAP